MPLYRFADKRPQIDPESWIAPDATLIGDVRLGRNASVWWKATLRGDNDPITVGDDSNIQDGSVLHGCTIGDGSLIGMGATVLNRARIGRHSIVGAHALIAEGREFPERSLIVGAPGRLIRQLSDEEVAALANGATHYIEKWRRCLSELERID